MCHVKQHCRGCPNAYNIRFEAGHGHDHNNCKLNSHILDTDGNWEGLSKGDCIPVDSIRYNKEIDVKRWLRGSDAM